MTVEVDPDAEQAKRTPPRPPQVDDPVHPGSRVAQDVFLAGIGGTGIVTVNQVLATAALRAGFDVETLDQTGLSQKAGPVTGHLRFADTTLEPSNRLTPGGADCVLAFDLLTATANKNLGYGDPARTIAVASTSHTPTGSMIYDATVSYPADTELLDRLKKATGKLYAFDALATAEHLFADTTAANFLVVGVAYQAGALRIPATAIEEAIGINGVAVQTNIDAFRWGRVAVADPAAFAEVAEPAHRPSPAPVHVPVVDRAGFTGETERLVRIRAADLVAYQGMALAERYVALVRDVWNAERAVTTESLLSEAVARYLFKLMAYKDEYEVARLLTEPSALEQPQREVPGGRRLTFQLHPPILRAMGRTKKVGFTPRSHGLLKGLARLKFLRGTPFDVFGYAHVRRVERALVHHFENLLHTLVQELSSENYDRWISIASLPDVVRGYEGVKLANVDEYRRRLAGYGIDLPAL